MKIIFLFALLVLSIGINAQKYVPFPTENADWNVFYASTFTGEKMDTTLLQYSLQGDTTINSTVYRKVCRNIGTKAQPIYKGIGGIREQNKKIYYYGLSYAEQFGVPFNQELLLYDFNKQIGDTVWLDYWRAEKQLRISYIITKIDSVKIGNDYRKRYNDRIIEGIGDVLDGLFGIITPIPTCLDCHQEWHFICFSQNGESVYKNPDYVDCGSTEKRKTYLAEGERWTQYETYHDCFSSFTYTSGKYQYNLEKDTIIAAKTYHKLTKFNPNNLEHPTAYTGGLREENGRTYFKSPFEDEFLLYDFTLNVGDTLKSTAPDGPLSSMHNNFPVVTKIDTIQLLTGEKRKVFYFNYFCYIEGIGCVDGLFDHLGFMCTCCPYYSTSLVCFKTASDELYKDSNLCSDGTCCDVLTGLENPNLLNPNISLSPNPVTGSSIIRWEADNNLFTTLVLTDVLGKTIKVLNVSGKTEISIQRNDFTPGLYFGRLHAANGVEYVIKMIIQ